MKLAGYALMFKRGRIGLDGVLPAALLASTFGVMTGLLVSDFPPLSDLPERLALLVIGSPMYLFMFWYMPVLGIAITVPIIALLTVTKALSGPALIAAGLLVPLLWSALRGSADSDADVASLVVSGGIAAAVFWLVAARPLETID